MQNLENMGVRVWGDGPRASHFGTGRFRSHAISEAQIVKDLDYLADNVSCSRLSDLRHAVNDKSRSADRTLN